jgi:hypothetical protein
MMGWAQRANPTAQDAKTGTIKPRPRRVTDADKRQAWKDADRRKDYERRVQREEQERIQRESQFGPLDLTSKEHARD